MDEWVTVSRTASAFSKSNPPGAHFCPLCNAVVATSISTVPIAACDSPGCCRVYHQSCLKKQTAGSIQHISSSWICPTCLQKENVGMNE
jgi:hypothetical protein